MKIYLVPFYISEEKLAEQKICPDATVEAEYGDKVIEGRKITLAHHVEKYANMPAPCCREEDILEEDSVIVISHIDLDTVGGCLMLTGRKPDNKEFWEAAGFIDCHGIHHIQELPGTVQMQLNAVYAWEKEHRLERSEKIQDVTAFIAEYGHVIEEILKGNKDYIQRGSIWAAEEERKTEACLICENGELRIFEIPDQTFCSAAYYSPKYHKPARATLAYSKPKKSITVAFEDGGKIFSAKEIVQELWGELAGGHPGIAGSPRNMEMTKEDWLKVQEKMKSLFDRERR